MLSTAQNQRIFILSARQNGAKSFYRGEGGVPKAAGLPVMVRNEAIRVVPCVCCAGWLHCVGNDAVL
jgi:hypothetical protein